MPAGVYWRLSAFYFSYFAVLGTLVPYLPLYLKSLGLDAWQIGVMTALMVATKIVAPNLWGWLADHTGRRMRVIRCGNMLAILCFLQIFWCDQPATLALSLCLYSFFWNAVLAQFEAITLFHLGDQPERYSRIRLWGSVGFIVAVAAAGWWFDRVSLATFPWLILGGLMAILISSLLVDDEGSQQRQESARERCERSFIGNAVQPQTLLLFVMCFAMVFSHGPYYTFFTLLMEHQGHSRTAIGLLWSLGVVAEIVMFWYMHRLMPQWGVGRLIQLSLAVTSLRWLLLAVAPEHVPWMILCQSLHAFSFGAFHAAAIEAVRRCFPSMQQGQAQALYSAVGYGAGNALGSLAGGWLWQLDTALPFLLSACACCIALLISRKVVL